MLRAVALLLTVLTGFSGLVYEVAWQKYLATLLGSDSEATAAILGIFLGGLSLGYSLFGSLTRRLVRHAEGQPSGRAAERGVAARTPSLLLLYGLVESSIGIWALLFPLLFRGVQALSFRIPYTSPGIGFAVDVLLTILLIGPPTILMGGTIPILTQALARSLQDATRFHAFVYAFNTVGAFAGALAAGFFLIPWLGLRNVVLAMGCVNLSAGSAFALLGLRAPAAGAPPPGAGVPPFAPAVPPLAAAAVARPAEQQGFAAYALVAFLSGFAMMTVQTVLNRVGGLVFGASHFTFSMVVAVFVLCIALGSFAVSAFSEIRAGYLIVAQASLVVLLTVLYLLLPDAPYWAYVLRTHFGKDDASFYPYYLSAFVAVLALLALPVGLSGAGLPLLFHVVRRQVGDLGVMAGRLYSWNTLGALFGALLGGYALLFWLDLHHVYRLAVAVLIVSAGVLAQRLLRPAHSAGVCGGLALVLVVLVLLPRWDPLHLSSGAFRLRTVPVVQGSGPGAFFDAYRARADVVFYDDDPTSSVAVWEAHQHGAMPRRAVVTNGKSDGEIPGDYPTMALAALVPALLADHCETGFVIGYGTGVTASELAKLESTRRVDVAEIARGVMTAAPLFEYGNQAALANPKLHVTRTDAYRALVRGTGTYDVIASEPSNPWVTGVEMLFSREFLQAARDHLTPGGVYAQWFHLYETDTETVALVLRTYRSVFDQVAVWYALGDDLLLLGLNASSHALDIDRLEQRFSQPDFHAGMGRAKVESLPALLAHEILPLGVLRALDLRGEVHTLFNPTLSHVAARAFFRGGAADLPPTMTPEAAEIGVRNSLLHRYAARFPGGMPDSSYYDAVTETLRYRPKLAVTLMAAWETERPDSPRLARVLTAFWRNASQLTKDLQPEDYVRLVSLMGDGAGAGDASAYDVAVHASDLFERYYHHAAPFHRDALLAIWRRCPGADGRCAAGLEKVEARIGHLRPESEPRASRDPAAP